MKNLKLLISSFIILFGVCANVYASPCVDVSDANATDGKATINLTGAAGYDKVSFKLSSNKGGTSIKGFSYTGKFNYSPSGTTYIIGQDGSELKLSDGEIGAAVFQTSIQESFEVTATDVKFYKDGVEENVTCKSGKISYIAPLSNKAYLTGLTVSQGELNPAFDAGVTSYSVTVPDTINSIKLLATVVEGATYTGTGNKTLEMGENQFSIVVTAEDGATTKTYNITVLRGEEQKPSGFLKKLSINNIGCTLSPEFEKTLTKYTVDVTEDINELDFKYEPEEAGATVTIEGNENFKDGENLVTITVEASDQSEKQVYEITVNKNMSESKSTKKKVVAEKKKHMKWWVILLIVLGILLLIAGLILILFKKKIFKSKGKKNNDKKEDKVPEESVTSILKGELYENDETTTYKLEDFKESDDSVENFELEKTKEFDIRDFDKKE